MLEYKDLPAVNSERWLSLEDLPGEIWKTISGFNGNYSVSCYGRVKSCERYRTTYNGGKVLCKAHIMRPCLLKTKGGYWYVSIHTKSGEPTHKINVHRLVAEHFVENPKKLSCVNHKDENPMNNIFHNLEWCDIAYNNAYGTAVARAKETRTRKGIAKAVGKYDSSGTLICIYHSLYEVAKTLGIDRGYLSYYCRNKKKYKGYLYQYI